MGNEFIPEQIIEPKIFVVRGNKVMLDKDLAELYGVRTMVLNHAANRNISRFPQDSRFQHSGIFLLLPLLFGCKIQRE